MRIGIDVGGTNTDAVLMNGIEVLGWRKTPTTPDVGVNPYCWRKAGVSVVLMTPR